VKTPTQLDAIDRLEILQESLCSKLREVGQSQIASRLSQCGREEKILICQECGTRKIVTDRCSNRWCCFCGPRTAKRRAEEIAAWSGQLKQPKHVVLTQRNSTTIRRSLVRHFARNLYKLRKQSWKPKWEGGTWTIELTNESRWVDSTDLAKRWGKLAGQDYAIVKVKDARAHDYCAEVAKYVCKPAQLTSWQPNEIAEVIHAFKGVRVFGVFGRLLPIRAAWRSHVKQARHARATCGCGKCAWKLTDPIREELGEEVWHKLNR
jgi:hypothetical protein